MPPHRKSIRDDFYSKLSEELLLVSKPRERHWQLGGVWIFLGDKQVYTERHGYTWVPREGYDVVVLPFKQNITSRRYGIDNSADALYQEYMDGREFGYSKHVFYPVPKRQVEAWGTERAMRFLTSVLAIDERVTKIVG